MRRVLTAVLWAVAVGALALLVAMVLVPRLTGWVPLTVLSGSMEPSIPAGSMIAVEPLHGEEGLHQVEVGDVVTFMPWPDDPTLVTHRVHSVGTTVDGETVLTTQGDANDAVDPEPVAAQQLRGKVRYHVPHAGRLSTVLNTDQKRTGLTVAAAGLFGYAGWQVLSAARARRAAKRG